MQKETIRKCQGCLKLINRNELIKITKLQDGKIKINPTDKELGRSVYVCKNAECIKLFIKKKRLKTALKATNMEEISRIEQELSSLL